MAKITIVKASTIWKNFYLPLCANTRTHTRTIHKYMAHKNRVLQIHISTGILSHTLQDISQQLHCGLGGGNIAKYFW